MNEENIQNNNATENSTTVRSIRRALRSVAIVNPIAAAKMASWVFFKTPPRLKLREKESVLFNGSRTSEFKHKKHRVKLWEWGDREGEIIYLVHGWGGRASQMAHFVGPLVDSGFRVVAMDLVGHGDSSGSRTSIPEMAEMLIEMSAVYGQPNSVIAHSMGSSITMLALKRGLKVQRFVGIAGPLSPEAFFKEWVGSVVDEKTYSKERSRMERRLGVPLEHMHAIHLAQLRREPMLWVHDRDDLEVPFSTGIELTKAWTNAKLHETQNLGHRRILSDPDVVNNVTSFLSTP